jgi:hypothetical protein
MFGGSESDVADLNSALQWVEGELSKAEGPFFLGKDFTLVRPEAHIVQYSDWEQGPNLGISQQAKGS